RHLVLAAAAKKDRGERVDLEAGVAKLFASEMCGKVTLDMMRVLGGYGYTTDFNLERYYRDAPLMIIGEGTNEIQRIEIATRLFEKYALKRGGWSPGGGGGTGPCNVANAVARGCN